MPNFSEIKENDEKVVITSPMIDKKIVHTFIVLVYMLD